MTHCWSNAVEQQFITVYILRHSSTITKDCNITKMLLKHFFVNFHCIGEMLLRNNGTCVT